jgi:hypothetical protein
MSLQQTHPSTLPYEDRVRLTNNLIDAWEQAETFGDELLVERLKWSLDVLGLPYVRIREDAWEPAVRAGECADGR